MSEADRAWQIALGSAFRTVEALCAAVGVTAPRLTEAVDNFPLLVPKGYADRMEYGNSADPLLRQVLISPAESLTDELTLQDPVGEHTLLGRDGLIRKYQGRALVITTGSCAVHCRYCFRRHFPYDNHGANLNAVIEWLRCHEDVKELILSGGDPLLLPNERLKHWFDQLRTVSHLEAVRIHTRIPVVLPERMTNELLELLTNATLPVVLVIHANHAQELRGACAERLLAYSRAGVTILNQAVLLAGVNDSYKALYDLSWQLLRVGVLPYYLHLLDRVQGAGHFEVGQNRAVELVEELRRTLPGYLVPRLVREIAGESAKSPIYRGV